MDAADRERAGRAGDRSGRGRAIAPIDAGGEGGRRVAGVSVVEGGDVMTIRVALGDGCQQEVAGRQPDDGLAGDDTNLALTARQILENPDGDVVRAVARVGVAAGDGE